MVRFAEPFEQDSGESVTIAILKTCNCAGSLVCGNVSEIGKRGATDDRPESTGQTDGG